MHWILTQALHALPNARTISEGEVDNSGAEEAYIITLLHCSWILCGYKHQIMIRIFLQVQIFQPNPLLLLAQGKWTGFKPWWLMGLPSTEAAYLWISDTILLNTSTREGHQLQCPVCLAFQGNWLAAGLDGSLYLCFYVIKCIHSNSTTLLLWWADREDIWPMWFIGCCSVGRNMLPT